MIVLVEVLFSFANSSPCNGSPEFDSPQANIKQLILVCPFVKQYIVVKGLDPNLSFISLAGSSRTADHLIGIEQKMSDLECDTLVPNRLRTLSCSSI